MASRNVLKCRCMSTVFSEKGMKTALPEYGAPGGAHERGMALNALGAPARPGRDIRQYRQVFPAVALANAVVSPRSGLCPSGALSAHGISIATAKTSVNAGRSQLRGAPWCRMTSDRPTRAIA